jgi:O-antigen ligase
MNQATGAGVLLLGLYPSVGTGGKRLLLMLGVLFMFWMAFAAEFRREILVTIPVVLGYLYMDKRSGLSRVALPLLVVSTLLFLLLLLPTSTILQERLERETPAILERREPRMVSFAAGLSAFLESPLVGHGPNSYASVVYPRLPYDADPIARGAYNVFVWIAVEAGILGLVGVVLVLVSSYLEAKKLKPLGRQYSDAVIRLGPLFIVLILIWFSFGNSWDGSVPWFLMGLIIAVARMAKTQSSNPMHAR